MVSNQALERARKALELFGIRPEATAKLIAYEGDVTIGANPVAAKATKKMGIRAVPVRLFRARMAKSARRARTVAMRARG